MESKTPMQELLQSAFNKSYYAYNGTGIDPQVIDLIDLEEIVQAMLPAESTLIAEHRLMKEALEKIKDAKNLFSAIVIAEGTLKNITL